MNFKSTQPNRPPTVSLAAHESQTNAWFYGNTSPTAAVTWWIVKLVFQKAARTPPVQKGNGRKND